ncbi:hypothetical protein QCM77_24995 [Bradyrhizobium sp. SSUT18]|nr:hypothetical protein [Bradyrhizobium sp. SSUT18]MDH2403179.1 hypothetical protein [Bradyrhizobium sp. SSUT18]
MFGEIDGLMVDSSTVDNREAKEAATTNAIAAVDARQSPDEFARKENDRI